MLMTIASNILKTMLMTIASNILKTMLIATFVDCMPFAKKMF